MIEAYRERRTGLAGLSVESVRKGCARAAGGYGEIVDFAAPPWWVQALWLVGVLALVVGGMRVSRALLVRAGRDVPPPRVERLFRISEWVVSVGMVVVLVLIAVRLVFS